MYGLLNPQESMGNSSGQFSGEFIGPRDEGEYKA